MADTTATHVWHEFASGEKLAATLAGVVAAILRDAINQRGEATMALSGGRTPGAFLNALSRERLDWSKVTVVLVDERFVPASSPRSNARLLANNLLQHDAARARFIPLFNGEATPEEAAARAAEEVAMLPTPLDVAVLGMGADGHTASLFPDAAGIDRMLVREPGPPVLAVEAKSAGEPRLTLSLDMLAGARVAILHIEGLEKKEALRKALGDTSGKKKPVRALIDQSDQTMQVYWAP